MKRPQAGSILLVTLVMAALLGACSSIINPSSADEPTPDPRLEVFTDPGQVEESLQSFLQDEFGFSGARVIFRDDEVTMLIEIPEAISDEQLTLIYLSALNTAARHAPTSDLVRLTMTIEREPFISIETETEHIEQYRREEIDLTAFVGGLTINAPGAGAASAAIPETVESEVPTEASAELTAELSVGPISIVEDSIGNCTVYALILNDGTGQVRGFIVQVDVYDDAGDRIEGLQAEVVNSVIPPGGMSAIVADVPAGITPARAEVSQPIAEYILAPPTTELSMGAMLRGADPDERAATIVTEIQNQGEDAIVIHQLVGLLMTENGEILAHKRSLNFLPQLLPGDSTPTSITWHGLSPETLARVERFEILTDALPASELRESGLSISTSTRVYQDATGRLHLIGLLRNDGSTMERPVLLGSLYNAQGELLDAKSLSLHPPFLGAGKTRAFNLSYWPLIELKPELAAQAATFDLRVDAYTSPRSSDIRAGEVLDYDITWRAENGVAIVEGTSSIDPENWDYVTVGLEFRDKATGTLIAYGSSAFQPGDGQAVLYEKLYPDPAYDLAEAELSTEVYAWRME